MPFGPRQLTLIVMHDWNMLAGWCGMAVGAVLGMTFGLKAESRDWADGYGSFRRQALRLGHIAAFALGIINVLYAMSSPASLTCPIGRRGPARSP